MTDFKKRRLYKEQQTIVQDIENLIVIDNTTINVPKDTKIFTFSDIHSDLHALIICLRDCAKVIRKRGTIDNDDNIIKRNEEEYQCLEHFLNININSGIKRTNYPIDLNYEWIGTNEQVVIIGDIIDGNREGFGIINKNNLLEHEYLQIELKILLFINEMIKQAEEKNKLYNYFGTIHKLLGNHEVLQILNTNFYNDYIYKNDSSRNYNYYKGISRYEIFNERNDGFNEIFKYGCRALLKINNNIFVHGQLIGSFPFTNSENYTYYENINSKIQELETLRSLDYRSQLWQRELGNHENFSKRTSSFCNKLKTLFSKFSENLAENDLYKNHEEFRLFLGHCVQSDASRELSRDKNNYDKYSINFINRTYNKLIDNTSSRVEIIGSSPLGASEGLANPEYIDPVSNDGIIGRIFGITMECPINNEENEIHRIYRVDVGTSRGFDDKNDNNMITYPNTIINGKREHNNTLERRLLLSRSPQVLMITDNSFRIIRSKLKNTRSFQKRGTYEDMIKKINSLNINDLGNDHYKQKYLKYKEKYIQLKNKFNNNNNNNN